MSLKANLSKLLATLPAILLMTFLNVFISSAVASLVMLQLKDHLDRQYSWIALVSAILTAVGTLAWILFNHKLREYINVRSHYE